mmetsp:Transcript_207/g.255  ORF Transcript_207/g.255 Transcript_207/m.255 type:complete len:310 (-) Transcript_207:34-963(-)
MFDLLEEELDYRWNYELSSDRSYRTQQRSKTPIDLDCVSFKLFPSCADSYEKMGETSDTDETSVMTEEVTVISEEQDNHSKEVVSRSSSSVPSSSKRKQRYEFLMNREEYRNKKMTIVNDDIRQADSNSIQHKESLFFRQKFFEDSIQPLLIDIFHQISNLDRQFDFGDIVRHNHNLEESEEFSGVIDLYEDNSEKMYDNEKTTSVCLEGNFIDAKIKPILTDISTELSNIEKYLSLEENRGDVANQKEMEINSGICAANVEQERMSSNQCTCKSALSNFIMESIIIDRIQCVCSSTDDRQSCHLQLAL